MNCSFLEFYQGDIAQWQLLAAQYRCENRQVRKEMGAVAVKVLQKFQPEFQRVMNEPNEDPDVERVRRARLRWVKAFQKFTALAMLLAIGGILIGVYLISKFGSGTPSAKAVYAGFVILAVLLVAGALALLVGLKNATQEVIVECILRFRTEKRLE